MFYRFCLHTEKQSKIPQRQRKRHPIEKTSKPPLRQINVRNILLLLKKIKINDTPSSEKAVQIKQTTNI